ncbi:MarR family transcriptional regulator [Fulvimarina sp. MAC8]|uniref:GbsR/MarR family transcriptional regulator n=1 Tax=Fulvimarina sp. MAC8 TaxID=3162874 RepID=UPI0032EAF066
MNQTPAATSFRTELSCEDACGRFIERMGEHMEMEGMPRIAGRLFGLLLVDPGPVSFSNLAERLGVSRGSVSTNARLLEGKGLIERVSVEGERQDFFRLADRPFVNMIHGIAARMRETMTLIDEGCRDCGGPAINDGVLATRDFFAEAAANLEELAGRLAERCVRGTSR